MQVGRMIVVPSFFFAPPCASLFAQANEQEVLPELAPPNIKAEKLDDDFLVKPLLSFMLPLKVPR